MLACSWSRWTVLFSFLEVLCDSAALGDPARAVHFSYDAPASCLTEAQFAEAVRQDGGSFAPTSEAAAETELEVRMTQGARVSGQVVVRDRAGRQAARTVVGTRCEDVARALAVLVSLVLEPASDDPRPPPVAARPPAIRAPDIASPAEPAGGSAALEPLPPGWRLGASAEGTVSGLGSMGLGLAAYIEVVHDVPDRFAPALRLGVELARGSASVLVNAPFGAYYDTASLTRRLVRLDACPLRAVAARPWSPSPIEAWACARVDAGVVDAVLSNVPEATNSPHTWIATGGLAHARWVIRRFFVDLEGGIELPMLRARFYAQPSTPVYQVPSVIGAGGLALGAYFL